MTTIRQRAPSASIAASAEPRPPIKNTVSLLQDAVHRYGDRKALGTRKDDGTWQWQSYRELGQSIDRARAGLARLGVGDGDRVVIISGNRAEQIVAMHAAMSLDATVVPIYSSQSAAEWQHILADSGAKVAIVADETVRDAVAGLRAALPALEHVVTFDAPAESAGSWAQLAATRADVPAVVPKGERVATIVYTSGTTGTAKGVAHTHRNLSAAVSAALESFPLADGTRNLLLAPLNHVMGLSEHFCALTSGAETALFHGKPKPESIAEQMREVQPTLLFAVPKLWQGIVDKAQASLAEKPKLVQRMVDRAVDAHERKEHGARAGLFAGVVDRVALLGANTLVFPKVREQLGGRLAQAASGSAPLSPLALRFLDAAGVRVVEGYGQTETAGGIFITPSDQMPPSALGRPMPGIEAFIDTSVELGNPAEGIGELLVRGEQVETFYWNNPEKSVEAFSADGSTLRTGDIVRMDDDGIYHFVTRKNDAFKLNNGLFVNPVPVEDALTTSAFIEQAVVHGGPTRNFTVALVVPNAAKAHAWAQAEGLGDKPLDELVELPAFKAVIAAEIEAAAAGIEKKYEVPRDFVLTAEPATVENKLMTPTAKVKRRKVIEKHEAKLDALYA